MNKLDTVRLSWVNTHGVPWELEEVDKWQRQLSQKVAGKMRFKHRTDLECYSLFLNGLILSSLCLLGRAMKANEGRAHESVDWTSGPLHRQAR